MAGNLTAMMASIFSGGVTADPYFEYTTLLLPGSGTNGAQNNTFLDASTNNFTITRNGNTTQGTFSPFSQTGWGNYFSGSSYLSSASNAAFGMGGGDYTIECWVYITATSTYDGIYSTTGTTSSDIQVQLNNRLLRVSSYTAQTVIANAGTEVSLNTWTHVAFCRSGTTLKLYKNGQEVGSGNDSINWASGAIEVGRVFGSLLLTGYMSNLRVVKGVAVYTGAFTPPTSPLSSTQSAGPTGSNIAAITGSQTSLLTCQSNRFIDTSTNNFTITRNGDSRVVAFSPFNPTASWSAATNGGSGYFDGSGDYLYAGSNIAFQMGTGDFTYECYVYHTNLSGQQTYFARTNGNNNGMYFYKDTSNYVGVYYTGQIATSNITITTNQWYYLVATRLSGILKIFINGTEVASVANTTNLTEQVCYIGADSNGTSPFFGYISNVRILKGTGYSSVSIPTAPLTAITNTSLLLNFTNAGIYDATSKNDLETWGNAQISNAVTPKWGSTSIKFDGTGDYLASAATNLPLTFNTGDFTIEGWLYPASVSGGSFTIVSNRFDAGANTVLIFGFGTTYGLYFHTQDTFLLSSGTNLTANTWQNVVLCRASGTVRIFLGGTQVGSTTSAQNLSSTASMFVGQDGTRTDPALQYNGYMQDVRITKGYARYVTGTGVNAGKMVFNGTNDLALPTAAFPTL